MAISHRKLFPYLTSNPNQTDCPSNINCDPPCSYDDCYLYPPDPVFFAPPPQLSTATDATAAVEESDRISPYVIIGVVTLVALFVLVTYYAVVVKCGWFSRAPQGDDANPLGSNDGDENEGGGGVHHVDHFDDPMVHPIWFITTVGLQQSIINAITVIRYKRNDGLIEGTDCSVCLSEFQEGETLRLLPKCSHAFHINCIDVWLRSHTNCPLCRTTIVLNPGRPSLASTDQSFGNSRRTEVTQFEESEFGVTESENSQIGNSRGGEGQNGEVIIFDGDQLIKVDDHDDGVNNRRIGRSVSMEFLRTRLMSFRMSRSYSWSERIFSTRQSRSSNSSILL